MVNKVERRKGEDIGSLVNRFKQESKERIDRALSCARHTKNSQQKHNEEKEKMRNKKRLQFEKAKALGLDPENRDDDELGFGQKNIKGK